MSFPPNWQANVPLAELTTMAVPARARWLVRIQQEDELPAVLAVALKKDLPVMILGGGSNVLFVEDFAGLLIKMELQGVQGRPQGSNVLVRVAAGENWHQFVEYSLSRGWHGLENLALIPGSVGAAPVQNIGAYGVELSDRLQSVSYYDTLTAQRVSLTAAQCRFAYRDSIFKQELRDRAIILSCTLRLSLTPEPVLTYPALQEQLGAVTDPSPKQVFDAVCQIRRSKLPDPAVLGNAGSFFRNPVIQRTHYDELLGSWPDMPCYAIAGDADQVKVPAAWLIEQAGWKGVRRGAVGVHDRQALVLFHDATVASDGEQGRALLSLAQDIVCDVRDRFGIDLQPEVQIIPASAWQV